jgi:tripartite-type tricarboxylate transporter receptor subunit TctC
MTWYKVLLSLLIGLLATSAKPQNLDWPSKGLRVVTAFAAGSASDILARMVAEDLQNAFKQPVLVENKPGASGIIAADYVAKSAPDGYTLFLTTNTVNSANPYLFKKLPYDPIKDFTAIGRIGFAPFVLAVNNSLQVKSVEELIAFCKKKENQASYAYGNSTGQIAGAAFSNLTHMDVSVVAYKSTPQALTDLMGGQVTFLFVDLASSRPHVNSGRVRALAISTEQKTSLAADLPTVANAAHLPGFDLAAWIGIIGPSGIPAPIVNKLNERLVQFLSRKDIVEKLSLQGIEASPSTAAELDEYMKKQLDIWGKKVRDAGIVPEV